MLVLIAGDKVVPLVLFAVMVTKGIGKVLLALVPLFMSLARNV